MSKSIFHDGVFHAGMFAAAWQDYHDNVIPQEAGPMQRDSMQQSFVAGALAYSIVQRVAIKCGGVEHGSITDNIKALDVSVEEMAETFFKRFESEPTTEKAQATGVHVEHFDAPDLCAADMDDLKNVIDGFIRERTAKHAAERASEPLAE